MLRNRTRTLSGRTRLRYKLLAVSAVLVVTVTCLVFIANSNTWTTVNAWMHTSQDNKKYENYKEERAPITADDGLFIDYLDDSEFTKETELNTEPLEDVIEEATADDILNNTECGDGKIYYSNELYDCDGLLKDPKLDRRIKEQKEKEPPESDEKEDTVNETPEPDEKNEDKILDGESGIHHILLHCGGNMPTAVDIFLDAYPDAELYDIYSFISDKSYSILYTKYKQHTTLNAKVSDKNETKKENIKTYGSAYESTQSVEYIDIAAWILTYINKSDEVVMILESDQEEDIAKHLVKTKAIGHIDKYYSIKLGNNSSHIDRIKKIFIKQNLTVNVWDNEARNFSDYDEVNRKHIPTPGMTISDCSQEDDSQKFLLILYSTEASVNALQVINFLQAFAHSGRLQTWIFLPYEMFKFSSAARLDMEALFHVFNVGMYISPGEDDAPSNVRNKAAFVNRMFEKQRAILEYILVERSTDRPVLNYLQDKENYKCLIGGVDITNLTSEVKKTGTMDIEETASIEIDERIPQHKREQVKRRRSALVCIFSFLDTRMITVVARVCREWRIVSRSPKLWRRVVLRDDKVSSKFLRRISRRCGQLGVLILENLHPRTRFETETVEEYQTNIRCSLEDGYEQILKKAEATIHTIEVINCGTVLSAKCLWVASCCCRMLKHVTYLSNFDPINAEVMWALGSGCRELKSLRCQPLYPCTRETNFTTRCAQMIGQCFKDLQLLSLGGITVDITSLIYIGKQCQKLSTIQLHRLQFITCEVIDEMCQNGLQHLKCLCLYTTPIAPGALTILHAYCKYLDRVIISLTEADFLSCKKTQKDDTLPDYNEIYDGYEVLKKQPQFIKTIILDIEAPSKHKKKETTEETEKETSFFDRWFK